MEGDNLLMTSEDRSRLYIIRQAIEKKVTQKKAGDVLNLSHRQIKRLCRRVKKEGDVGVIHKNRGKASNRKIDDETRKKIMHLAEKRYQGFGPTLLGEQLLKKEGIKISDETLRLWMIQAQLPYPKRRGRPHKQWRDRKLNFGEMLQMDGSHHDWLEGRGPRMVLMGYIDDATGRAYGRFYEYEGTLPAFDGLIRYFRKYGMPGSIYLDKHSAYKGLRKVSLPDQFEGDPGESHFQRAMKELGIEVIHANSPQAKGRIERLFRTLQDRLVKEMRLAGICTIQEANSYLTRYLTEHNHKFTLAPAGSANLHRPVPKTLNLRSILSVQTHRFVRNDFTVMHHRKIYQIKDRVRCRYIRVEERTDGSIHLMKGNSSLRFKEILPTKPPKNVAQESELPLPRRQRKPIPPPQNHPWRNFIINPPKQF